ncbi:MAG: hypothetical protein Q8S00_10290 [Deltaproteobacteria bacterium]|nr:hypothetical protein [Deltaproteobacteria bacterium]
MNGIETSEWMALNEIAGQKKDVVLQFYPKVSRPIPFKLTACECMQALREIALAELPSKAGEDLRVGYLGRCHDFRLLQEGLNQR